MNPELAAIAVFRFCSSRSSHILTQGVQIGGNPVPLYAAMIEDLGPGDFVKVDCAGCSHTALLAPAFLSRLGLSPRRKVLDLKNRVGAEAVVRRGGLLSPIDKSASIC
jgi:hypothetical protein